MKALIFNSGLGSRLGELTKDRPKSLVRLGNGETIFHRQLRVLTACGIREFVVTTGPFAGLLEEEASEFVARGCDIRFVPNPIYDKTNYIYSMYCAREWLREGDFLMLHGDLVFDAAYAQMVVDSELPSLGSVNTELPLPEKDFKARVVGGEVREVSVKIFDADCVAFQPFYKLSEKAMGTWLSAIESFVAAGETGVYAENAANTVFERMGVAAHSYAGHFVEEVDTPEDLARVSAAIRLFDFEEQPVFTVAGERVQLADGNPVGPLRSVGSVTDVLAAFEMSKPFIVTSSFFPKLNIAHALDVQGVPYQVFTDFNPNPQYDDVMRALQAYLSSGCDSLLSVGGGSAIDIAKCVKQELAIAEKSAGQELKAKVLPFAGTPHVACPTTAGTGSESTHFAVCYVDGVKVSVANDCLQPNAALLDSSVLAGLPDYQKKCTMLDALCQAIESYWSVRSSERSRAYSAVAIPVIMQNAEAYLSGDAAAAAAMLRAANLAGKAINLTTTTAPHAMSYKITSMYGIPHGHAVAMCMQCCWRILLDRAEGELRRRLVEIAVLITGDSDASPEDGLSAFERFFGELGISATVVGRLEDVELLTSSVNLQRLSNFPMTMDTSDIRGIYVSIIRDNR